MPHRPYYAIPRSTDRASKPRPVHFEITWRNPVSNETVDIRITQTRDYLRPGQDHLEVESIRPDRAPLPITASGYRSHFLEAIDLITIGGPVSFVEAWLAHECLDEAWRKRELARCQGDLFRWADTQAETTTRKARAAKRTRPRQPAADDARDGGPRRAPVHGRRAKPSRVP